VHLRRAWLHSCNYDTLYNTIDAIIEGLRVRPWNKYKIKNQRSNCDHGGPVHPGSRLGHGVMIRCHKVSGFSTHYTFLNAITNSPVFGTGNARTGPQWPPTLFLMVLVLLLLSDLQIAKAFSLYNRSSPNFAYTYRAYVTTLSTIAP